MNTKQFLVPAGQQFRLKDHDPGYTGKLTKSDAKKELDADIAKLRKLQNRLYSSNTHSILLVFQGMDASGKDSAIEHILWEVNPAGYHVASFKAPTSEELAHDYLWRHFKELPQRGRIGVFNRSHYEEVLVVKVHPEILEKQNLPANLRKRGVFKRRYEELRDFEKFLVQNGTVVLKFFLNVSKDEQRRRFLERRQKPSKRWKFSLADVKERRFWPRYMRAYESAITNTSTSWAPWHVIPADNKWFSRAAIANIIVRRLAALDPNYPAMTRERRQESAQAKKILKK